MITVRKQQVKKKEVDRLFSSFKKEGLLQDRSEYDEEDLSKAYPHLNKKGVKLLYLKLQKWKYSKVKGKKSLAMKNNCLSS